MTIRDILNYRRVETAMRCAEIPSKYIQLRNVLNVAKELNYPFHITQKQISNPDSNLWRIYTAKYPDAFNK